MPTTTKKKLLYIPSWYINPKGKDPSVFMEAYARMFHDHGYETTVLHTYMKGSFLRCLFKKKIEVSSNMEGGMNVIRIGIAPVVPYFRTFNYWVAWQLINWYFKRKMASCKFDIVNSHVFFLGGYIASNISKKYNIPHVHTEHFSGFLEQTILKRSEIKLFLNCMNQCDQLVLVSKSFKDHFIKMNPELENKATVIPNFITNEFSFVPTNTKGPFKFLAIGASEGNKNIRLLLNAWSILSCEIGNCELTLLGTDESVVQAHFNDSKIPVNINIITSVPHHQVPKIIQEHHCLVSTSYKETFGLSILEALACGRPVVTTNSGGILDFVNESNGIVCLIEPKKFAASMQKIWVTFDQYQLKEISSEVHSIYSKDQIFKKYDALFNKCLSQP